VPAMNAAMRQRAHSNHPGNTRDYPFFTYINQSINRLLIICGIGSATYLTVTRANRRLPT
jgi:hypothetical protein